jgi:hypothetical protein
MKIETITLTCTIDINYSNYFTPSIKFLLLENTSKCAYIDDVLSLNIS